MLMLLHQLQLDSHRQKRMQNLEGMLCSSTDLLDLYKYLLHMGCMLFDLLKRKYLLHKVCSHYQSTKILQGILDSLSPC